jgi:hypothetical protein
MKNTLLRLTTAVAAVSFAAACVMLPDAGDSGGWRRIPERASKSGTGIEQGETIDFREGGTLSLENDYGNVVITGWDNESVEVLAKPAGEEARSQGSARISRSVKPKPSVEIRETTDGVLVRTPTFEGPGEPPTVDYEIRVPHSVVLTGIRISEGDLTVSDVFGRLEVSLDKGNLSVTNYSGDLKATVGTGDADVEVLDLREGDSIAVTSRRGDIVLRLESGVGAIVEADAPQDQVRSDFDLGAELPARTIKGWIGQGGPSIILRASDGRIDIRKIR